MGSQLAFDENKYGRLSVQASVGDDEESVCADLQLVKNGVRVHFLRYGYFKPYKSEVYNSTVSYDAASKTFELNKVNADNWINESNANLVAQKRFKVAPTVLNEGYLYIFDNENIDLHYEFKVDINGSLIPIYWDANKDANGCVKDIRSSKEKTRQDWVLQPDRDMSVVFSYVQWSVAYHTKVKNNEEGLRDKRCMAFSSAPFLKGDTNEYSGRKLNLESVFFKHPKEINRKGYYDSGITQKNNAEYKHFVERENANKDDYKSDIFIILDDPLGAVLDIMNCFVLSTAYFISYVSSIQTGRSAFDIYVDKYGGDDALSQFRRKDLSAEEKGVQDMFNFTAQVYQLLYAKGNDKLEMVKTQKSWTRGVDLNKILNILAVDKRKSLRAEIRWIQDAVRKLIYHSNLIKSSGALFDFLDDTSNKKAKLFGKSLSVNLLGILASNPNDIDRMYDVDKEIEEECVIAEKYQEHLLSFLENKQRSNPINKLLFAEVDITNIDTDSDVRTLTTAFLTQTLSAFKVVASKNVLKGEQFYKILCSVTVNGETFFDGKRQTVYASQADGSKYNKPVFSIVPKVPISLLKCNANVGEDVIVKSNLNPSTPIYTTSKGFGDVDAILGKLTEEQYLYPWGRTFKVIKDDTVIKNVLDSGYYATALHVLNLYNFYDCLQAEGGYIKVIDVTGNSFALANATLQVAQKVMPSVLEQIPRIGSALSSQGLVKFLGVTGGLLGATKVGADAYKCFEEMDADAGVAYSFAAVALGVAAFGGPFGLAAVVVGMGCLCMAAYLTDDRLEALLKHIPLNNHQAFNFNEITRKNNLRFYNETCLDSIGIESDSNYNFMHSGKYNYLNAQTALLEVQDKITSIEHCPQKGEYDFGFGNEEAYFTEYMETHIYSRLFDLHSVKFDAKAYFIEENYLTCNKARPMNTIVTKARDKRNKPFIKVKIYPKDTFSKWDRDEDDAILKFSFTLANFSRVPFEKDKHIMAILDWEGEYNKREKKYYFNNGKLIKESEIKLETVNALEKGTVN